MTKLSEMSKNIQAFYKNTSALNQTILDQMHYIGEDEGLLDVACHGMAHCPRGGFVYYTETEEFFKDNRRALIQFLNMQRFDHATDAEMVSEWMKGSAEPHEVEAVLQGIDEEGHLSVQNCVVWAVVESMCHEFESFIENIGHSEGENDD